MAVDPPLRVAVDPPLRGKKSIYMGVGWVVGSVEDGAHGGEGDGEVGEAEGA